MCYLRVQLQEKQLGHTIRRSVLYKAVAVALLRERHELVAEAADTTPDPEARELFVLLVVADDVGHGRLVQKPAVQHARVAAPRLRGSAVVWPLCAVDRRTGLAHV